MNTYTFTCAREGSSSKLTYVGSKTCCKACREDAFTLQAALQQQAREDCIPTHTRWCGVKCARISARRREIGAKKQPDICRRPVVQVEEGRGGGGEVAVGEGGEEEEGGGTVAPRDQKQSSVQLLLHQARSCLPPTLHIPVCLSHTQTTTITIHTIS